MQFIKIFILAFILFSASSVSAQEEKAISEEKTMELLNLLGIEPEELAALEDKTPKGHVEYLLGLEPQGYTDIYQPRKIYHFSDAQRSFAFPKAYLSYGDLKLSKDNTKRAMLFYTFPDLKSQFEGILLRGEHELLGGQEYVLNVVISAPMEPFDKITTGIKNGEIKLDKSRNQHGLDAYKSDNETIVQYVERNLNLNVLSIILCRTSGYSSKENRPICTHMFNDKGLAYVVTWPMSELAQWNQLQQKFIQFIDQYETKNQ